MEELLKSAGQMVLDLVRQQGLEGEAYLLYERELSIEISEGRVDTLKEAEQMGMGLRVFNSGRMGFAYSSDLSAEALKQVVSSAVSISAYTAADQFNRFPAGGQTYPVLPAYNQGITARTLEDKIDMAMEVERDARAFDRRVQLVEQAGYEDSDFANLIMNTRGLYAFGRGSYCGLNISLAASEDDDTQNGFAFAIKKDLASLDPKAVGEEAALKAVRSLHARTIASGCLPCVMDSYVVTRFTGLLSSSLQADAVQKGKSMLAGKEGQQVASAQVTLVDDATHAEGIASFPFDGEGVPARRNVVIANGQLQGFLYDTYTGLKAGLQSSGNAVRGSFRGLPGVGTTNFLLHPGSRSPANLIADIEKGLFITDVMGMHTANPISGDFSLGAAGLMIEQGKLTCPVRGITIAGNLFNLLQDIEAVANDLRFYGGKAAPAVRLQSISIGGY
ncbi:MAG: TldD/PmbA family protein [Syntrophomonadaceae bacterium]|nr:TldD/PmbA family protein [Syntrophomonadaceae bacterium]